MKQVEQALLDRFVVIARKFGADPLRADKQTRAIVRAILMMLAADVKLTLDKGTYTVAELDALLDAARDDTYPDEPTNP